MWSQSRSCSRTVWTFLYHIQVPWYWITGLSSNSRWHFICALNLADLANKGTCGFKKAPMAWLKTLSGKCVPFQVELYRIQTRHPTPPDQAPPPGAEHAGRYGQRAGGTHPTGVQSCSGDFFYREACGKILMKESYRWTALEQTGFSAINYKNKWNYPAVPPDPAHRILQSVAVNRCPRIYEPVVEISGGLEWENSFAANNCALKCIDWRPLVRFIGFWVHR